MRLLSLLQKIIVAVIILAALAGIFVAAVTFWPSHQAANYQFPIDVIGYWKNEERNAAATTIFIAWSSVSINTPQLTITGKLLTLPVPTSSNLLSFKVNVTDSSTASEIGKVYECSVEVSTCPVEYLNMTLTDPDTNVPQVYQFMYKRVIRDALSDLPQLQLINYKVMCGPSDAYIHLSKPSDKINEPELVLSFNKDKLVLKGYDTHNSTTLKLFLVTKISENPEIDYVDASRSVGTSSNFSASIEVQNSTDYSVLVSTDRIRALIGVRVVDLNTTEHWVRLSYAVLSYSVLSEKQATNFSWTKNNTAPDLSSTNGTVSAWPVLNVIQRAVLEAPYKCRGYDYDLSGLYLSNYTAALDTPDLLYDGSCYRPLFTSVIEYDDFGFISNIGNVPLTDLSVQAALSSTVPLKSALQVAANSTYIVFESKQHVRSLFALKVTDQTENAQLTLEWVPLFFAKEEIAAFSPGFSWSAKNRLTAV